MKRFKPSQRVRVGPVTYVFGESEEAGHSLHRWYSDLPESGRVSVKWSEDEQPIQITERELLLESLVATRELCAAAIAIATMLLVIVICQLFKS